jgi:hypothetical protein
MGRRSNSGSCRLQLAARQVAKVGRREQKIKTVLNASRSEHTAAVKERIVSVGELKDVVGVTKSLFELSKVRSVVRGRFDFM